MMRRSPGEKTCTTLGASLLETMTCLTRNEIFVTARTDRVTRSRAKIFQPAGSRAMLLIFVICEKNNPIYRALPKFATNRNPKRIFEWIWEPVVSPGFSSDPSIRRLCELLHLLKKVGQDRVRGRYFSQCASRLSTHLNHLQRKDSLGDSGGKFPSERTGEYTRRESRLNSQVFCRPGLSRGSLSALVGVATERVARLSDSM